MTPDPSGWNVYRWLTEDGSEAECIGSAPTAHEAHASAVRLGGAQIQRGLDGEVEGVQSDA